jgi:hypothetical protein
MKKNNRAIFGKNWDDNIFVENYDGTNKKSLSKVKKIFSYVITGLVGCGIGVASIKLIKKL